MTNEGNTSIAHKKLIAVCGPGSTATPELEELAYRVGRELALNGLGVVCGGMGGVMLAACKGAKEVGGLTVGIVPSYNRNDANPFVDFVICTGLGEARNMLVSATGMAIIAVGGEWGTLSEIALGLKINRPVITIQGQGWKISRASSNIYDIIPGLLLDALTPEEAVKLVMQNI